MRAATTRKGDGPNGPLPGMTTLHIDFETRSAVDLKKTGVYVYAEDQTTDVWCAAWAVEDQPVEIWRPDEDIPPMIEVAIEEGWTIVAHNANFERTIWHHILTPRYDWPEPKLEQWRCTMVMAYAMGFPGALDMAAPAAGLDIRKDMAGKRLMLQMSKPRKIDADGTITWWDEPEKRARLYEYCAQDVEVERQIEKRLLPLRPLEQKLWQLDQIINDRGVQVDLALCEKARQVIDTATDRLDKEMSTVTERAVGRCSNVMELKAFVADYGLPVDSLAKDSLAELLARDDLPPEVRRALELRQEAAKASVAKIKALMNGTSKDGRARGLLQFYAASPGRWGGRRFQPQNLKRPEMLNNDDEAAAERMRASAIQSIMTGSAEIVEFTWGPPLTIVSDSLRGLIVAADGKKIMAADYSSVEGRGVAWYAGEDKKVEAYRSGADLYKVAAGDIYGIPREAVDKQQRQIGKVSELACGYQGGVGAFQAMAYTYRVKVPDEQAADIVKRWRLANSNIVQLWWDLDEAAREAVRRPGTTQVAAQSGDKLRFKKAGSFLFMQIPSGRCLCYPYPRLVEKEMPWKDYDGNPVFKTVVTYKGIDSYTRKWGDCYGYGGLWLQNATEAVCRDLLAGAMLRLESSGFPVILTVHDEIVTEPNLGFGTVENFESAMCELPAWAEGFPLAASGFEGERYHK
jgi:DNA polymerase bacteriophage-type